MYSLPITTYSDYWRATKVWSLYLGGLAVLTAGTRYSALEGPAVNRTIQPTAQQTTLALDTNKLGSEVSLLLPRQRASIRGTVSRGVSTQGEISRGVSIQGRAQGIASQAVDSEATEMRSNKIEAVDIEIPYETKYVESDKLLPGETKIQEKGQKGILHQVVKTFKVGGLIEDQQVQSSLELKSPKTEVILQNSKPIPKKKVMIQNSAPVEGKVLESPKMNIRVTLNVDSTAYTFTGNKTATGVQPSQGMIAVDPKVIPLGSRVYVEGYGYAIAADTGGAIRGNRIDVFFPTLRQCINWGRKSIHIYIINPI